MKRYTDSPKTTVRTFHRTIETVNVYTRTFPTSSTTHAAEKTPPDVTPSILKLIGFKQILLAITRESVQHIFQQFLDAHNLAKEVYTSTLLYKNIFLQRVSRIYFGLYRKVTTYVLNSKNTVQTPVDGMAKEDSYNDDYQQMASEQYDDFDSHSTFSNADTDISSPQIINPKVAELENEILLLKQQLSFVLTQMNIKIPPSDTQARAVTSLSSPPPIVGGPVPPPPLPANLLKCSEVVINRAKQSTIPENVPSSSQAVPRITEILGDLTKVQLRRVPRSPGGTPCRNRVATVGETIADAVKNAMDKRRKDFDVSLDESGLNDSWEEEKEN